MRPPTFRPAVTTTAQLATFQVCNCPAQPSSHSLLSVTFSLAAEFTAFLMTLRRKNIAPHGPLVVTYGVMLSLGFLVSTYDHYLHGSWLMVNTLANVHPSLGTARDSPSVMDAHPR